MAEKLQTKGNEEYAGAPTIEKRLNPATEVFERVAKNVHSRSLTQMIVSLIFTLIFYGAFYLKNYRTALPGKAFLQIGVFLGFNLLLYVLPLSVFGCAAFYLGAVEGRPICSCRKIRLAYRLTLENLPVELRNVKDPYKSTPWLLKHNIRLRQYLFWSYMMVALVMLGLIAFSVIVIPEAPPAWYMTIFGSSENLHYYAVVYILFMSSLILIFEKRMPNFTETSSGRRAGTFGFLIIFVFLGFFFFFFEDSDCSNELDKKYGYEY